MANLDNLKNLYEVRKTVRFWLTQSSKKWNHKSHLGFDDLVSVSFKKMQKIVDWKEKICFNTEKDLVEQVKCFIDELKTQLWYWKDSYSKYHIISINKDYYKILARKAKFNAFKKKQKMN